jgi:hypothetical protein
MERSIQGYGGQTEFRERLRLEVLFAETTELFAWPGSSDSLHSRSRIGSARAQSATVTSPAEHRVGSDVPWLQLYDY